MSDLTAQEIAGAALTALALRLPGVRYVEQIGEVPHRISLQTTPDGDALVVRVEQESTGFDEAPQLFRIKVRAEEIHGDR